MSILQKSFYTLLFLATALRASAQHIGGVVNSYSAVSAVDYCNNRAVLINPNFFAAGDLVLLIQMKGGTIDNSATPTYGSLTALNNAGNYELLTITSITSGIATFQQTLLHHYDLNSGIQLVKVATGVNIIIDSLHCAPWDGSKGGVAIVVANASITLNGPVNADSMGLLGGDTLNSVSCVAGGAGYSGYACTTLADEAAAKGEGIGITNGNDAGMGANANGGGGGNDHDAGGGGGANYGAGGDGGRQLNVPAGGCNGNDPGLGGHALPYAVAVPKIFAGGGGGAGDMALHQGTRGGNGGGIIILMANTINGNNQTISANGQTVHAMAHQDAAGGGGAGGTVLLQATTISGNLTVRVNGGRGGNTNNANNNFSCMGPGGGGGGGLLWVSGASVPAGISFSASPGNAGGTMNGNAPGACAGSSNGALAGTSGNAITGLTIPFSTTVYVPLSLQIMNDTTICSGGTALLHGSGNATPPFTFSWSSGGTGTTTTVQPVKNTDYLFTITDARGCTLTKDVNVLVNNAQMHILVFPSDTLIIGDSALLQISDPGFVTYQWTPTDFLSDSTLGFTWSHAVHDENYCLIATDPGGCQVQDCITLHVVPPPPHLYFPSAFTPNGDGINDLFFPIPNNACYHILDFKVYNRWGGIVYEYTNAYPGWDGRNKFEEKCEAGEYVFTVQAECSGKTESYKGAILLIR